ncbi:MAG: hypothetical protein GY749_50665 [Desulfobacteraceae bacterium]|nr:hypothetical protein [Desulfobacteraceae bacterium]
MRNGAILCLHFYFSLLTSHFSLLTSIMVIQNINITLCSDELLESIQKAPGTPPLIMDEAKTAAATASELCRPVAMYKFMKVQKCGNKCLVISDPQGSNESVLSIGGRVDLLKPAKSVLVCAYTIGSELDEFKAGISESGDHLQSYLLDSAGLAVLAKTGAVIRKVAEKEAAKKKWGVSAILSPGSLEGWFLTSQSEISRILDLSLIGVKLNEAAVLTPYKSVSCIIGTGPGYTDKTVGSTCKYCSCAGNCSLQV